MKSATNSVTRIVIAACAFLGLSVLNTHSQPEKPPVRIAIAGLEHDHAMGIFPRLAGRTDVQLVGIVETNPDLIARYSSRFHLDPALFYPDTKTLFAKANVQAVAIFFLHVHGMNSSWKPVPRRAWT